MNNFLNLFRDLDPLLVLVILILLLISISFFLGFYPMKIILEKIDPYSDSNKTKINKFFVFFSLIFSILLSQGIALLYSIYLVTSSFFFVLVILVSIVFTVVLPILIIKKYISDNSENSKKILENFKTIIHNLDLTFITGI